MSDPNDLLQQYESSLCDLRLNSKPMISMLTILAEESQIVAEGIVQLIENRLYKVPPEQKLFYLYLVDSIIKNVGKNYAKLFSKNLVKIFCHVFEKGDENVRKNLYKLRQTWKEHFSQPILYQIDVDVKELDPAWPITANLDQIAINPNFFPKMNGKKELNSQQPTAINKLEPDRQNNKRLLDERSPSPESKRKSPNVWNNLIPSSAKNNVIANNNHSSNSFSSIPGIGLGNHNLNNRDNSMGSSNVAVVSNTLPLSSLSSVAQPILSSSIQQPSSIQQQSTTSTILNQIPGLTFNQTIVNPPVLNNNSQLTNTLSTFNNLSPSINQNKDVDYRINEFPNSVFNFMNNNPQQTMPSIQPPLQTTFSHSNLTTINLAPEELKLQVDGQIRKLYYLDDHTAIVLMNCLIDLPFEKLRYISPADLAPRLISFEGPPVNVYIDDKYKIQLAFNNQYKSFYHHGIEQRIKFGGPAKEIFLNGIAIQAKFGGEAVLCELLGDSNKHELRLDSPAPKVKLSDEPRVDLWSALLQKYPINPLNNPLNNPLSINNLTNMNNLNSLKPLSMMQNQSVIPPITQSPMMIPPMINPSMINPTAISQQMIQPPPIIPQQTLPQSFIPPPSSFFTPTSIMVNPNNNKDHTQQSQKQTVNKNQQHNFKEQKRQNESTQNEHPHHKPEKKNKKQKIPVEIKEPALELKPESLKIKRPSLIDSLYSGQQCTNCSLRFDNKTEKGKAKYSAHLDWHFRQNRRVRDNNFKTSNLNRDWYLPSDLWVKYKEINMDENSNTQNNLFENNNQMTNEDNQETVQIQLTIKAHADKELNKCVFCNDHFNEVWIDEEEEWRLENAVYGKDENGQEVLCHPTCSTEKLNKSVEDETTLNSEETLLRISESMLENYEPTAEFKEEDDKIESLKDLKIETNEDILSSIKEEIKMEESNEEEVDESSLVKKTVLSFENEDDEIDNEVENKKEGDELIKNDKLNNNQESTEPNGEEANLKVELIGLDVLKESDNELKMNDNQTADFKVETVKKIELVQQATKKPILLKLNIKESNLDLINLNNQRKNESKELSSPKSDHSKSPVDNYLETSVKDKNVIYRGKEESALCSIM